MNYKIDYKIDVKKKKWLRDVLAIRGVSTILPRQNARTLQEHVTNVREGDAGKVGRVG